MIIGNRWLGVTASGEKFAVIVATGTLLLYEIEGKTMHIRTDGAHGHIDISRSSMQNWTNDNSPVDPTGDEQNAANIIRALESLGFTARMIA